MKEDLLMCVVTKDYKVENTVDKNSKVQSEKEMRATVDGLLKSGTGHYNLSNNNCECLASIIRYGKPISPQVI